MVVVVAVIIVVAVVIVVIAVAAAQAGRTVIQFVYIVKLLWVVCDSDRNSCK